MAAELAGARPIATLLVRNLLQIRSLFASNDAGAARRLAGGAFAMRVVNAAFGFATQILLARWMGAAEYGIYAYLWVWVLTLGSIFSLGLPVATLKFVPDYTHRRDLDGLRGFLRQARTTALLPSIAGAILLAFLLTLAFHGAGDPSAVEPYWRVGIVALAALPFYVLTDIQTGIARAYDDADLGLAADYLVRPFLLLAFAAALALSGGSSNALAIMMATLASVVITAAAQGVLLQGRIVRRVPPGPARADTARWFGTAAPLLAVTGFTVLLGSTDIIVLKLFVGAADIARYFAATKITAVASFVAYGVAATSSHRFAAHMATGDKAAAARLASETVRWTFWPTLAVIVGLLGLGRPLLSLFGTDFADAWPVLAILAAGLLAQAAVGPADRALSMMEESGVTARIYAVSFGVNVVGALALTPLLGLEGAALSTTLALVVKSALLYATARDRLGLDMFVLPRPLSAKATSHPSRLRAEIVTPLEAAHDETAWADLAGRAIEPNSFFTPAVALAALQHLPEGRGASVLRVWHDEEGRSRLVGLLPLVRARGRCFNPLPIRRANVYGPLSTPLVAPERAEDTLDAMLDALGRAGIVGLLLPFAHEDGPVAAALGAVAARRGGAVHDGDRHARAFLSSNLTGGDYVRATLETKRRKEADRQRRRLAEEGALEFRVHRESDDIAAALDAFLTLERSGWKGRQGTDLATTRGGEAFIRDMGARMMRAGDLRVVTLNLDGQPIAAGLVLVCGRRAFYFKTAYDERWARFSPGLLLTLDLTAHLLDDPEIDDADSIAVADHSMIDRVWTARFPIASLLVSTGRASPLFVAALLFERLREEARRRYRKLRSTMKARRSPAGKDAATKNAPVRAD